MNRLMFLTVFLFVSLPLLVNAGNIENSIELSDGTTINGVESINKKQPEKDLTIEGIIVGHSNLADVKERFGAGELYHEGDAGRTIYVLCYKGKDGSILSYESGDLGGDKHDVFAATIYGDGSKYRLKDQCATSDLVNKAIKLNNGLHLGMSPSEIMKICGRPSKKTENLLLYFFRVTEPYTGNVKEYKGNKVDVISSVEIVLMEGKSIRISISKTETM